MKKVILSLFFVISIFLLSGCGEVEQNNAIEEEQPKITYVDITKDNITEFVNFALFITHAMPDCSNPYAGCTNRGYYKLYNVLSKYNNVEFENVNLSLEYEAICYTDNNYSDTITVTTHLDDIVLGSDGNYYHNGDELLPFGNNQKCYSKQSERVVVSGASGRVKITE